MALSIVEGRTNPPARVVLYGPSGSGKSTWACGAPDVLALDAENGLDQIGPRRVIAPSSWIESLCVLKEMCAGQGSHRTVVIDTGDKLQEQAIDAVCKEGKKASIEDFGYGSGWEAVLTKWRELLFLLEAARPAGRQVILVAHVQSKIQDDPMLGKYDKFIAAISKRCWGVTHRWADAVLFATYEQGLIEGRAIMTGERLLYTTAATGFDAKNRWKLPPVLPLSWSAFDEARRSASRPAEEIVASIRSLSTDETRQKAEEFIKEAGGDVPRLVSIETALKKKIG